MKVDGILQPKWFIARHMAKNPGRNRKSAGLGLRSNGEIWSVCLYIIKYVFGRDKNSNTVFTFCMKEKMIKNTMKRVKAYITKTESLNGLDGVWIKQVISALKVRHRYLIT